MPTAMQNYRKTLIPMQTGIVLVCAFLWWRQTPFLGVVAAFVVMQIFSLLGAFWGARLQRKVEQRRSRRDNDLPPLMRTL
jgi:uncharacterized membrane protein YfcA